ncbi:MAG: hypothetical protein K0S55_1794 [Clostridia bacterium]|nr:hypothetical protein [Clostridia bacterium]
MKTPLYDALLNYKANTRLHTPGHKGHLQGIFSEIAPYDVTELSFTDDLYNPKGVILEAERLACNFFETKTTVFSAGGASLCIQTALSFFQGKKVLFDRNSHKSAFNAANLLDIEPLFIYNDIDDIFGIPLPVTAEMITVFLKQSKAVSAVFITSPNYFGLYSDIKAIKNVCEKCNVVLIVDNAHGTHLYMTDKENSAQKNADIIIDSAHKTLPVLTGGAFLHFNNNISYSDIKSHISLFGSTSPSFLILASLDYARGWCVRHGIDEFGLTEQRVEALREIIEKAGFLTIKKKFYDKTRITISTIFNDIDGYFLATELEKEKIIPEMADKNNVVILFSPFNDLSEYEDIKSFFKNRNFKNSDKCINFSKIPQTIFKTKMKTAYFGQNEIVQIQAAVGRIAAESIVPYPPGVPVLLPGELITEDLTQYLQINHNVDSLKVIL